MTLNAYHLMYSLHLFSLAIVILYNTLYFLFQYPLQQPITTVRNCSLKAAKKIAPALASLTIYQTLLTTKLTEIR